jgi:hypothetical protein
MAGTVNHRTEDRLLAEALHWIMDGEPLTTAEERRKLDYLIAIDDDEEIETTECMQCQRPFVQAKAARRHRVFCQGCRH